MTFTSRLYAIVDPGAARDPDPVRLAHELLAGGCRWLQLRWKTADSGSLLAAAREIRSLTRERDARLVVNDRADVARAVGADGVHLGQEDLPPAEARAIVGPETAIGVSTHDPDQALRAEQDGADYVGFGPLFGTGTKDTGYEARGLGLLREVRIRIRLPIVAIGGIDGSNATRALRAGADAVAMISHLVAAPHVRTRVEDVLRKLRSAGPAPSSTSPG